MLLLTGLTKSKGVDSKGDFFKNADPSFAYWPDQCEKIPTMEKDNNRPGHPQSQRPFGMRLLFCCWKRYGGCCRCLLTRYQFQDSVKINVRPWWRVVRRVENFYEGCGRRWIRVWNRNGSLATPRVIQMSLLYGSKILIVATVTTVYCFVKKMQN